MRVSHVAVFCALALSVAIDGLLPLEKPNTARELVFGTAVGAGEGGSLLVAGEDAKGQQSDQLLKVASATAGSGVWVERYRLLDRDVTLGLSGVNPASTQPDSQPYYPRPAALPREGPAATSSPLPDSPRQGTERGRVEGEKSNGQLVADYYGAARTEPFYFQPNTVLLELVPPLAEAETSSQAVQRGVSAGLAVQGIATYSRSRSGSICALSLSATDTALPTSLLATTLGRHIGIGQ